LTVTDALAKLGQCAASAKRNVYFLLCLVILILYHERKAPYS